MNPNIVVIDTNVFISALLNLQGTPRKSIELAIQKFQIIHSEETYLELVTRIHKRKFDKYISTPERLAFLEAIKNQSQFIEIKHQTNICSDADDNKFLELAVSGMASYLITGDDDLLCLKAYAEIQIVTPAEFLMKSHD
ncbi:putative toxin-antitoxin system toxin component, PIN family [Nostocales cyanobacterium LEGE 11386]|nr:putative toxin-antitoxin system toxin component, PIN family [Nostocales cyanobacterium LEGE 11386]